MNEQVLWNRPLPGAQLNMSHPLTRGLVGCWLFNENGGIRAMDISPYGHHGTLTLFTMPPHHSFNGLLLDGTATYVDCGNPPRLQLTTIMAEVWIKLTKTTYSFLIGKRREASLGGWTIASDANNATWVIAAAGAGETRLNATTVPVNNNQWHQVVGSYDGVTGRIFIDGQQINTVAIASGLDDVVRNVTMGKDSADALYYLGGQLALARIWNTIPLGNAASAVKQLYQNPYEMILR